MSRDVFISYSHEDQAIADKVVASLENSNMRCWISSRDEIPGENWREALARGLDESKVVVFILSTSSDQSKACARELSIADEKGIPIIPLRVEDISPTGNLKYLLVDQHRLDAITRPIDKYLNELVSNTHELVQSLLREDPGTQNIINAAVESATDANGLGAEAQETDSDRVKIWIEKAAEACEFELYDDAVTYYDKILGVNPNDASVLNAKALTLMNGSRYQEALECCERAAQYQPDLIDAWKNMGRCLQKLDRPDEALNCYEKALYIEPLDPEGKELKGSALLDLDQNEAALQSYSAASRIARNKNAEYLYGKGLCLAKLGSTEESLESLNQALVIEPGHQGALHAKGTGFAVLGRDDEAVKAFDEELTIEPKSSETWFHKGEALTRLGRDREAIKSYDKALEIDPRDVHAWYNKGVSLNDLDHHQETIECYDTALEIDPRHINAQKAKE
jgi:tetratricopeptide (TPR) repeat protein